MKDRPLTARSVLASALLGTEPPELPVAALVRIAALFDLNENRVRVALSRMVANGEAATDGDGRYRLAGPMLDRQHRQRASRAGASRSWAGGWTVLVLTTAAGSAAERTARRRALVRARLGERREGVWLRPDDLDVPADEVPPALRLDGATVDDPVALAAALFDLAAWSTAAHALLARLDPIPTGPDDLAPGFILSASVLRHLQADPLLPSALLPPGWPGPALRDRYAPWDAAYRALLSDWIRRTR